MKFKSAVNRSVVCFAVLLTACDANTSGDFVSKYSAIKAGLKVANSTALASGSVATNIAVLQVLNALSKEASGTSVVAGASSAKVYRLKSVGIETQYAFDEVQKKGWLKGTENGRQAIDITFEFSRTPDTVKSEEQGKIPVQYELNNITGSVSGFSVNWKGKFAYSPRRVTSYRVAQASELPADIACDMVGSLSSSDGEAMNLEKLSVRAPVPATGDVDGIGSLKMTKSLDEDNILFLEGQIGIKGDRIVIEGTSSVLSKGKEPELLSGFSVDRDGKVQFVTEKE